MTRISDMTPLTIASPTGVYVPVEKTGSTTNYRVDLAAISTITPQIFGAVADGVTDDSASFVAAIAYLKSIAVNDVVGVYKGSPTLFIPAGHYYLGTTTLDITHTLIIEGEGAGRHFGVSSRLRWAAGATGIRTQRHNTSSVSTVDAGEHFAGDGLTLTRLKLEGAYTGTEGEFHGVHAKTRVNIGDDVWIQGWQGEGIRGRAIIGGGSPNEGDFSVSIVKHSRIEDCRIGMYIEGADANVVTLLAVELIANRQAGYVDNNGAGSNTLIGIHAASNGVVTGAIPTQCSYSGRRKALKWGGDPTVAPSTDTTDTANWLDIEAGGSTSAIPAWVATPNTFRAGGDYVTLNSAGVHLVNCYSENGGFSQFSALTLIEHGTIGQQYFRGGQRIYVSAAGYTVQLGPSGVFRLQSRDGEAGVFAYDQSGTGFGYLDFIKAGDAILNGITGVAFRHGGAAAGHIDTGGLTGVAAVTATGAVSGSNLSGTNTGDQTAGAGITLSGGAFSAKFKNLFNSFADVQNSTTTETDIFTNTTAAGELAANGDRIEAQYSGVFVSSATATRQLKVKFAGTTIFDSGALTLSLAAAWDIYVTVIRVSSTVIRYSVSMTTEGAALAAYTACGELTGLTLSNTNILKLTGTAAGTGAATGDIVGKLSAVDKKAA